jgi:hypothetical protein
MNEVIINGIRYVPDTFKVEFNNAELKIIDEIAYSYTMTRTQVVMTSLSEMYAKIYPKIGGND